MIHRIFKVNLLLIMVAALTPAYAASTASLEYDVLCRVTRVIDGDTIACVPRLSLMEGVIVGREYRIRLADINAPELRPVPEEGAIEATMLVRSLVEGREVILDVDDLYITDRYGRLVAVVLVEYNETHLVNVNKLLVVEGLARVWEHDNEWVLMDLPLFIEKGELSTPTRADSLRDEGLDGALPYGILRKLALPLVITLVLVVLAARALLKSRGR